MYINPLPSFLSSEIHPLHSNMAYSHASSKLLLSLLLLALLLAGSCSATMRLKESGTEIVNENEHKKMQGFTYQALVFNFFPKGSPIPPSGPSKRHNSVVDSKPQN